MKSHVLRRGIPLAVHTGSLDVFIRTLPQVADHHSNWTGSPLHQPGSRLENSKLDRKVVVKPQTSPKSRPRVQREVNDNYCVFNVAGVKDSIHVSGKKQNLNPLPVTGKSETVFLHVNSFVANVHSVTGLPQKKVVNPNYCCNHTEIKHVNNVSCVGHSRSANAVTNAPTVAINSPVGAMLQQFWEKWEALGSSPKVVTILREGYTLPFQFRPNLTRSPMVISNYVNPQRQSHLLEALYQLTNKNAVELVTNQNFHLHRLQERILPYTNSQSVQEVHAFSHPGSILPVQALPFGLSTAPMEFTVVAKEVKLIALQRGIRIHQYLDDWLVRATSTKLVSRPW